MNDSRNQYEIDFSSKSVLFKSSSNGHTKKLSVDFNQLLDNDCLNYISEKEAYRIGITVGACNTNKINHTERVEPFKLFNFICLMYVMLMIISNILSLKLVSFFGFTITGAMLVYPFTYIFDYIISDVYGYKYARRCIHLIMISLVIFIISIILLIYMPPSQYWHHQNSLEEIFGLQIRVFTSSLIAFSISIFVSSYIIQKIKKKTKGRYLLLRIILSLLVSEIFDTTIFCLIAFAGIWPIDKIGEFIFFSYLTKVTYEVIMYPFVTSPLIKKIKIIEKTDIVDINTNFNPILRDVSYEDSNNLYR